MQKYKLINKTTNEEHLCEKVVIDGFDYYVTNFINKINTYINESGKPIVKYIKDLGDDLIWGSLDKKSSACDSKLEFLTVIATNSPNIDIPKVLDEVEKIYPTNRKGTLWMPNVDEVNNQYRQEGYYKSQSTHPNSDEDMIEFTEWCNYPIYRADGELSFRKRVQVQYPDYNSYTVIDEKGNSLLPTGKFFTTKGLIEFWKEQKVKTIYYE